MPESLPQNEAPLEQAAKKYLASLKAELLPESLYSLQAAKLALEKGKDLDPEVRRYRPELGGWVESLLFADQDELPRLLDLEPNPLPDLDGEGLARELLIHLLFRLKESDPSLSLADPAH